MSFFYRLDALLGWEAGRVIGPVKTGCWFVDGDILNGALHVL